MKLISSFYLILTAALDPGVYSASDRNEYQTKTNKQTPWPLVRERTIPTDRSPLVDEI
jgi:hypothetical protein